MNSQKNFDAMAELEHAVGSPKNHRFGYRQLIAALVRSKLFRRRQDVVMRFVYSGALVWALQCVACAAVAWVGAQGLWWLATPGSLPAPPGVAKTLKEQHRQVVVRHFFDEVNASSPSMETVDPAPSDIANSSWRLLGTYVDSGSHSLAVMSQANSAEVVVAQVGTRLPTGHDVEDVRADTVVLVKGAQRSELTLRSADSAEQTSESPVRRFERANSVSSTKDPR